VLRYAPARAIRRGRQRRHRIRQITNHSASRRALALLLPPATMLNCTHHTRRPARQAGAGDQFALCNRRHAGRRGCVTGRHPAMPAQSAITVPRMSGIHPKRLELRRPSAMPSPPRKRVLDPPAGRYAPAHARRTQSDPRIPRSGLDPLGNPGCRTARLAQLRGEKGQHRLMRIRCGPRRIRPRQ
jgi:hypothetical protein